MKPTHETHPFIYSIFLAPPKQGIYLHLCCRHTSINILISTHLYRRMQILAPFAPLLIHSNLRAICTSVDPLELYPRIYKMQRIHVDKRLLPKDSFQKKELVDFGTKPTGIDSFQKKESVDLGTQCTEEKKILAFPVLFHFSFFSTISSQI